MPLFGQGVTLTYRVSPGHLKPDWKSPGNVTRRAGRRPTSACHDDRQRVFPNPDRIALSREYPEELRRAARQRKPILPTFSEAARPGSTRAGAARANRI